MADDGDELDPWRRGVAAFVEAHLPAPPARVLEIGCGDGWLCHHLADASYEVQGIDPDAPEDPLLVSVALADFDPPTSFDAVVAVLCLHHIPDVAQAVDKIADLLVPTGSIIVVVEFAWDRFDDETALWCLDRLTSEPDHNWLQHRCEEIGQRRSRGEPLLTAELFRVWAEEEGFHSSSEMIDALRTGFSERHFEWGPYLHPELNGITAEEERTAIDAGVISATSFRFVGTRA